MLIYKSLECIPHDMTTVVSIGEFDGVHIGHQKLIRTLVRRAKELEAIAAVVTFDPHPLSYFRPGNSDAMLTPLPFKLRLFEELGIGAAVVLPFTKGLASMSPREFVSQVLVSGLRVKEIHEGANFRFGNSAQLADLGREFGFSVKTHTPIQHDGERVSSSRIRKLVSEGNTQLAGILLSRSPWRRLEAKDEV